MFSSFQHHKVFKKPNHMATMPFCLLERISGGRLLQKNLKSLQLECFYPMTFLQKICPQQQQHRYR